MTALLLAVLMGAGAGPSCGPYLKSLTLPPKAYQSPATRRRFKAGFDRHFRHYGKRYWGPTFDWRLLKAQAWAESGLREKVVARDGGRGIAQFMPATARWVAKAAHVPNKPLTAKWGIAMQAFYLRQIFKGTQRAGFKGPDPECFALALAGYNSGPGNARRAWRLARKPKWWCLVARQYHRVTGRWARITIKYVGRIRWAYLQMRKGR